MYFVGVDLGTSGCKVILIDETGDIVGKSTQEYPLYTPNPNWSEQNPDEWYKGVCDGIKCVISQNCVKSEDIVAISISGQMVGLVTLDKDLKPIRPCILWNDQRSVAQADKVTSMLGLETVINETGNAIYPSFFAPKVLWLKENEPDNYKRIRHIMFPKDYIVFRLTSKLTCEVSDISGSCLFNVETRQYSPLMLKSFGVKREFLPEDIQESEDIAGKVTDKAAAQTGLSKGTIVGAGGGDQSCQAIGSGIVKPNMCLVTIGTSGVVFLQSGKFKKHPQGLVHSFRHSIKNNFYMMGVMLSAGASYQWLRNMFKSVNEDFDYKTMNSLCEQVPAGSNGLMFLPYLTGERCPHNDPYAKGCWIGLTLKHRIAEMTRSVMEGITFGLYDLLNMICDLGNRVDVVYASGGATNSTLWLQMIADIFGIQVMTTNAVEGGALGAAILAGVSASGFSSVQQATETIIKPLNCYSPKALRHKFYADRYLLYRELYCDLQFSFPNL